MRKMRDLHSKAPGSLRVYRSLCHYRHKLLYLENFGIENSVESESQKKEWPTGIAFATGYRERPLVSPSDRLGFFENNFWKSIRAIIAFAFLYLSFRYCVSLRLVLGRWHTLTFVQFFYKSTFTALPLYLSPFFHFSLLFHFYLFVRYYRFYFWNRLKFFIILFDLRTSNDMFDWH